MDLDIGEIVGKGGDEEDVAELLPDDGDPPSAAFVEGEGTPEIHIY